MKKSYDSLNNHYYQQTLDISAVSLHKILHYADETDLINEGGSMVGLTYIGAQRIFSKYSGMNDAKALLESSKLCLNPQYLHTSVICKTQYIILF